MRILSEQQLKKFKEEEKANKSIFARLYEALTKSDVQFLWRSGYRAGVASARKDSLQRSISATKAKSENMAEITMAISRGYCSKKNENKELDIDLVNAIGTEVSKVLKKLKV